MEERRGEERRTEGENWEEIKTKGREKEDI